jgi:hypothetical protein
MNFGVLDVNSKSALEVQNLVKGVPCYTPVHPPMHALGEVLALMKKVCAVVLGHSVEHSVNLKIVLVTAVHLAKLLAKPIPGSACAKNLLGVTSVNICHVLLIATVLVVNVTGMMASVSVTWGTLV